VVQTNWCVGQCFSALYVNIMRQLCQLQIYTTAKDYATVESLRAFYAVQRILSGCCHEGLVCCNVLHVEGGIA
jgi:hypothetical protein